VDATGTAASGAGAIDTAEPWFIDALRMRKRTPDFSTSSSSMDSRELKMSMISLSSFKFIRTI
jgi:hypothetical protein